MWFLVLGFSGLDEGIHFGIELGVVGAVVDLFIFGIDGVGEVEIAAQDVDQAYDEWDEAEDIDDDGFHGRKRNH